MEDQEARKELLAEFAVDKARLRALHGTAILSRVQGDRRRIYTVRYALTVKGRLRGAFEWGLDEVGSGPLGALEELLALVPARGVEDEPPVPVPVERWVPPSAPAAEDTPAAEPAAS